MSGRSELHALVRQSIERQGHDRDESPFVYRCGCEQRGERWWLCQYHEGMGDGIELSAPVPSADATPAAGSSVGPHSRAHSDHAHQGDES